VKEVLKSERACEIFDFRELLLLADIAERVRGVPLDRLDLAGGYLEQIPMLEVLDELNYLTVSWPLAPSAVCVQRLALCPVQQLAPAIIESDSCARLFLTIFHASPRVRSTSSEAARPNSRRPHLLRERSQLHR
jgi:hypothetical protein